MLKFRVYFMKTLFFFHLQYWQSLNFFRRKDCVRLGSAYGGWLLVESLIKQNSHVLSVGAGLDLSFDSELANNYGCIIDIYDPTPRAYEYFKKFENQIGKCSTIFYQKGGHQPINSYDLENAKKSNFNFVRKAIWIFSGKTNFFEPSNLNNVSYSITGYDIARKPSQNSISVECEDILKIKLNQYSILKMDIEGAEADVIERAFKKNLISNIPQQVLIEFDLLKVPKFYNYKKVSGAHSILKRCGYKLLCIEGNNFSYFKE